MGIILLMVSAAIFYVACIFAVISSLADNDKTEQRACLVMVVCAVVSLVVALLALFVDLLKGVI